jgi:hypothetical protein
MGILGYMGGPVLLLVIKKDILYVLIKTLGNRSKIKVSS